MLALATVLLLAGCGDDAAPPDDAAVMVDAADAADAADAGDAGADATFPPVVCSVDVAADGTVTDTCEGDTICICPDGAAECTDADSGRCQPAFGRDYAVAIVGLDLDADTVWDPDGPPDPFVRLTVDDVLLGMTPTVPDTFSATWDPPVGFIAPIVESSRIVLEAYDDDGDPHDLAFTCDRTVTSAFFLRRRTLSCTAPAGTLFAAAIP